MTGTRQPRRGIYVLPTLFTVGNFFCGYYSLVQSSRGFVEQAALLIIVAGVLDGLDGRIARMTGTTSEFGVQFDSLADLVSFGVAPSILAYHWALHPFGRIGWLIGFLFAVCAATRLARFNIRRNVGEKRHFAGLPSPMAAGTLATVAFAFPSVPDDGWLPVPLAVLVAGLGLLMVSRLRYRSFKEFDLGNRRSYTYVLPLAAMIVAIAIRPKWSLLTFAGLYLFSAPTMYVWGVLRHRVAGRADAEVVDGPAAR